MYSRPSTRRLLIERLNRKFSFEPFSANTMKDKAAQKKYLCDMLKNMTAEEQKWLIRIIMKELKMGLSQQSVFSVFHQDAEDLFNVKMSLEKVKNIPSSFQ